MIFFRLVDGIKGHFHMRVSEWVMIYPAIGIGAALLYQVDLFQSGKSFSMMDEWMTQGQWALAVLLIAGIRLIALVVNGTFENFPYSPHMRLAASFVGIFFWSQFTLGFLTAAVVADGAWSAPVAYSTMCFFELINVYRTWADVARGRIKEHGIT